MEDLQKTLKDLLAELQTLSKSLKLEEKQARLGELEADLASPDVWQDHLRATSLAKEKVRLEDASRPWLDLVKDIKDALELCELSDNSLENQLKEDLKSYQEQLSNLKKSLRYSGKYDSYDAVLSLHAGTGGTDAQDWAEMLKRMYLRYCDKKKYRVEIIDESSGEEAGIKSISFSVSGNLAYGNLKSEHGVHRLVRLSPFNSDNLRQTSFAKLEVVPIIEADEELNIEDKDLKIDVYRAGGHGGQSVNTTDSAVRITHLPTGIIVAIQNERSQLQNKETAMNILKGKLAQLKIEQHKEKLSDIKGPSEQAAWGNQIRSYVLHPYTMVKDLRTKHETSDAASVLDGELEPFVQAYLEYFVKF